MISQLSTSVQPPVAGGVLESSSQPASVYLLPFDWSAYQQLKFGSGIAARERLIESLEISAQYGESHASLHSTARKLRRCCSRPTIRSNASASRLIFCETRCKSRLCETCRKIRGQTVLHRLTTAIEKLDAPRFITLTLDHCDDDLSVQLQRLRRSFARLRRSPAWRSRCVGGAYSIEITFNRSSAQWHPHLHAITDGTYFPHAELRSAWMKASHGATIVDIRKVHSARSTAKYISQYITKGVDAHDFPDERFAELAVALRGLRMIQCFGSLHGVPLVEKNEYEPRTSHHVSTLESLAASVLFGDPDAKSLLARIRLTGATRILSAAAWESVDPVHETLLSELELWLEWRHGPDPPAFDDLIPHNKKMSNLVFTSFL